MSSRQTIQIHLTTPDTAGDPVCISGTFNKWAEHEYKMNEVGPGEFHLEFELPQPGKSLIEFKFLRSRWANVELDEFGGVTDNRVLSDPGEPFQAWVPRWRNAGRICDDSLLPVQEFHHHMVITGTRKKRRVSVLLPYDYYFTQKKYPVLYLMDGQNLFEPHAPFGSWEIHKKLAVLAEKNMHEVIVVCIDHAGPKRIEEYNYIRHHQMEKGRGVLFLDWIEKKLKPFIDGQYRTLTDTTNTGIGGSSMGGLIALMAGITKPELFGKLMILSPSIWKIVDLLYDRMMYLPLVSHDQFIYLYAGGKEASNMKGFARDFFEQLRQVDPSNDRVHFSMNDAGQHQEKYWGREFPHALKYLFY